MINKQTDPVAWTLLLYELEDAEDGLKSLFKGIAENEDFGEAEFQVHMAHIYAHLNRAWNRRNISETLVGNRDNWSKDTHFPQDLKLL